MFVVGLSNNLIYCSIIPLPILSQWETIVLLQLKNSYNNLCAVKNTITLNALYSQKKDQKCHLLKNEPIFAIIDSVNE